MGVENNYTAKRRKCFWFCWIYIMVPGSSYPSRIYIYTAFIYFSAMLPPRVILIEPGWVGTQMATLQATQLIQTTVLPVMLLSSLSAA